MKDCEQMRAQTAFYLDGELEAQERDYFEAHLRDCGACRERCARAQAFLEDVRKARPLVTAPLELRAQIDHL